jgi:Mg2+ and Co2+ transporter CorA
MLVSQSTKLVQYFNINAQKDSEAAARLTRNATLLARLSVVFLPVSLMTSYFSVQISDLQGVYTAKDYWYSFAGLMSGSFLALFFFGRLLIWITETLDLWAKHVSQACAVFMKNRVKRKEAERGSL